jgi:hypothetical protein
LEARIDAEKKAATVFSKEQMIQMAAAMAGT